MGGIRGLCYCIIGGQRDEGKCGCPPCVNVKAGLIRFIVSTGGAEGCRTVDEVELDILTQERLKMFSG